MSNLIKINTTTNEFKTIETQLTIEEYKKQGKWPLTWISASGLLPEIEELSKRLGRNVFGLEIGVCRGENIVYFLEKTDKIEKIDCIDPYLPYDDWNGPITKEDVERSYQITLENFLPHRNRVELHKDTSINCVSKFHDEFFDYIFIDGDHSYQGVLSDISNYYSKLKKGGIFSGHDINLADVRKALLDFRTQNNIKDEIKFTNINVWYWIKS